MGHPAAIVQGYEDLANDPQAAANGYIVEREHPVFGLRKEVGLHIQLSETPGQIGAAPPSPGNFTVAALRSIGIGLDDIRRLAADGVVETSD